MEMREPHLVFESLLRSGIKFLTSVV